MARTSPRALVLIAAARKELQAANGLLEELQRAA